MNREQLKKHLIENVPRELLVDLAKKQPGHNLEKLYKDMEDLVNEILRVCKPDTLRLVYEEFPTLENFVVWFYGTKNRAIKSEVLSSLKEKITGSLREGIEPDVMEEPTLYRIQELESAFLFRYAAADSKQSLSLSFGEKEAVKLVNYYSTVLHFSDVSLLILGPYAASKAQRVVHEFLTFTGIQAEWLLLRAKRGESREFYNTIKKKLGAYLIETKRHDPTGNYKTIALEARDGHPDLERVADFKKNYLHADSYYDVLRFSCHNRLSLDETTWVKFGYPFGRFSFRSRTSLSAILYFESKLHEVLH